MVYIDFQVIFGIVITFIGLNCLVVGGVLIGLLIAYLRMEKKIGKE